MDPLIHIGLLILLCVIFLILSRKSRHEGFEDIVSSAVQKAFGPENADYIRQSAEKYNPLMNLIDSQHNPLLSEKYSRDEANATATNIAQALISPGVDANNPSFDITKATMNDILINRNSKGSARQAINNAESYKTIDCKAFDDKNFAQIGGICHEGGIDSGGNKMIGGLYISEDDKTTADIMAKRMNSKIVNYTPTVGKCNPYMFSTTKQQCNNITNQMNCVKGQSFDTKGCGLCFQDDSFHYIEPDVLYNPPSFQVIGSGTLIVTTNSSPLSPITLSTTPQKIDISTLQEGDVLQFNVTPASATLSGFLIGQTVSGHFHIDLVRLVQSDTITGANPRLSGMAQMGDDQYTIMRPGRGKDSMNLSVLNTFSFVDPSENVALKCGSPYIKTSASLSQLNSSPCYKKGQVPGAYSLECLQKTFQDAGCTSTGTGYPSDTTSAQALMIDSTGHSLTIGKIASQVYAKSILAYSGKDVTGNQLSIPDWNIVTSFCTGQTITSPCDTMNPSEPISTDCLNYLWQNAGVNTKSVGTTYTSGSRMASLHSNNDQDQFCTSAGLMSPIDSSGKQNQDAITTARRQGPIAAIKSFYDSINITANNNTLRNSERKVSVKQCYGIELAVASAVASPVTIVLKVNTVIGTVDIPTGDYTMSFTLTPNGIISDWGSLIHITTGENTNRAPGIWFVPNTTQLHIRIGDATDWNWGLDASDSLPMNVATPVSIVASGKNVTITVGSKVIQLQQPTTRPTGNGFKVYMSDPWYPAMNASVTDFKYIVDGVRFTPTAV